MGATPKICIPTVCDLARLGPERAARRVDEVLDAIAIAMIDADDATTQRLKAEMDAFTDVHLAYFREQPKHVRDAEFERIRGDMERLQLDEFAARYEGGAT